MPTITTIQVESARGPHSQRHGKRILTRVIAAVIFLVMIASVILVALVASALLLPLLAASLLLGAVWYVWFRVRRTWLRARSPNGVLDGRENVRVRTPEP